MNIEEKIESIRKACLDEGFPIKEKNMKKPRIYSFYLAIILFIFAAVSSSLFFISYSKSYDKTKYTKVNGTVESMYQANKIGWVISIEEDEASYRIIPISDEIVKTTEIQDRLLPGEKVDITFTPYRNNPSVYDIMGIQSGNDIILDVDDMINRLQKNDRDTHNAGIILVSSFFAIGLVFLIAGIHKYKTRKLGIYGERKIEIEYMGNFIDVYLSSRALTLVINGDVTDKYEGSLLVFKMELKGKIATAEGEKNIFLKVNAWGMMRLYSEETVLAKKWMPLN